MSSKQGKKRKRTKNPPINECNNQKELVDCALKIFKNHINKNKWILNDFCMSTIELRDKIRLELDIMSDAFKRSSFMWMLCQMKPRDFNIQLFFEEYYYKRFYLIYDVTALYIPEFMWKKWALQRYVYLKQKHDATTSTLLPFLLKLEKEEIKIPPPFLALCRYQEQEYKTGVEEWIDGIMNRDLYSIIEQYTYL